MKARCFAAIVASNVKKYASFVSSVAASWMQAEQWLSIT
jgi:hypothetical protein